jgi:hypothetical protein
VTGEVSDSGGERRLKLKVKNHVCRVHCIMVDKRSILKLILPVHHRPLNIPAILEFVIVVQYS